MARISTHYQAVLRAYTESSRVNSIPLEAEALFIRLLCLSDGEGRYHGDPFLVCARALTHRMKAGVSPEQVDGWLHDMEGAGLIQFYDFQGERHIQINRYHDAGNKSKVVYPPPPFEVPDNPSPDDPPAGDKKPPARKKKPRKAKAKATTGDSRARITNTNTNKNTSTSTEHQTRAGAEADPPEEDRGQAVDKPATDEQAMAKHLAFHHLVPVGIPHGDIPELVEHLGGPRWAGGFPLQTCEAAVRSLALRARGQANPSGIILEAVRSESASQNGLAQRAAPEAALESPVLDAGAKRGSSPVDAPESHREPEIRPDEAERKATHHRTYASQLETQAAAIERSRPEEAAALRDTAERHLAAAKQLDVVSDG